MSSIHNKLKFDIDYFGPEHIAIVLFDLEKWNIHDYYFTLDSLPEDREDGNLEISTMALKDIKNFVT